MHSYATTHDTAAGLISLTRRTLLSRAGMFGLGALAGTGLGAGAMAAIAFRPDAITRARLAALPTEGRPTGIVFGGSIARLIDGGVIDPAKFDQLYVARGNPMPGWMADLLKGATGREEIVFDLETAPHLLSLLWPVGLATRTSFNAQSPIAGENVDSYASTGGWPLGQADMGGIYFNSVDTVDLNDVQSELVLDLAQRIFRPCCDNSTFFQDCNHGSAVLGLLELGAAQGADRPKLENAALAASAFWYPDQMTEVAIHREILENESFADTVPMELLGAARFSISGWMHNVHEPLARSGLLPQVSGGQSGCGV